MKNKAIRKHILLLLLILICTFIGCTNQSPQNTVTEFFSMLQSGSLDKASFYILNPSEFEFKNEINKQAMIKVFKLSKYRITSSTVENSSCVVNVEFTTPDMNIIGKKTVEDTMAKISLMIAEGKNIEVADGERIAGAFLTTALDAPNLPLVTNEYKIELKLSGFKWKIIMNEELKNRITGSMMQSVVK